MRPRKGPLFDEAKELIRKDTRRHYKKQVANFIGDRELWKKTMIVMQNHYGEQDFTQFQEFFFSLDHLRDELLAWAKKEE